MRHSMCQGRLAQTPISLGKDAGSPLANPCPVGRRSRLHGFRASVVVTVAAGSWVAMACDDTERHGSCPLSRPSSGSACDYAGPACSYEDACGYTTYAVCAGNWVIGSSNSCNPPYRPEMFPCPQVFPSPGTACGYSGQSCYYVDSCGSSFATCTGNQWQVSAPQCGAGGAGGESGAGGEAGSAGEGGMGGAGEGGLGSL